MKSPRISVVADEFTPQGAAQQLLDRLAAGYPRDGDFRPGFASPIRIYCSRTADADLDPRVRDLGINRAATIEAAVDGADAVVFVGKGKGHSTNAAALERTIGTLPPGGRCFIHGLISVSKEGADRIADLAQHRNVAVLAGTPLAVSFRLPEARVKARDRVRDALIVVQGPTPDAWVDGIHGLMPDLERAGVSFPIDRVEAFMGDAVWQAQKDGLWPGDLLAAALSRSNNPQGDPITDGRTQDLYGLGLVPGLARDPRAWIAHHGNECRSTILALDGVVTDVNFALRLRRNSKAADRGGDILSTQLYQPPAPGRHAFDALAAVVDDFFRGRPVPWSRQRAVRAAAWFGALQAASG